MSKFYFYDKDDEFCHNLSDIKDRIFDDELTEKKVFEAKRETGNATFFCKKQQFVGESGQHCGKECEYYKPRNGKNGRCIHSGYCYYPDKEVLIKI
jgi:hypothetical protein